MKHGSLHKTILQDARRVCRCSDLTATKLYHLRQTPLALHRHETRENTVATLMLCKVFPSRWRNLEHRTHNLFFLSNSFALSSPLRNILFRRRKDRAAKSVSDIAVHTTRDTENILTRNVLSFFFCRESASRMYVRGEN